MTKERKDMEDTHSLYITQKLNGIELSVLFGEILL